MSGPDHVRRAQALNDIADERRRQVNEEGFTPERDDMYVRGELAQAACAFAWTVGSGSDAGFCWPWKRATWKPTTPRRDLVKAAALIIAEIERLDRLAAKETT